MARKLNITWTMVAAVLVCLTLCIGGMYLSHWYAERYFPVSAGENPQALLGDSFGAVNALISAFAFAGVIVAIIIERNELMLQRKDLSIQQQEFATQNATLQLQRFENTFFNMLTLQQRIVLDLCHKDELTGKTVQGRELFFFSFEIMLHIVATGSGNQEKSVKGMRHYLSVKGLAYYDHCHTPSYFDHYFRHLYTIIKFIDNSDLLTFDEKYKYTTMVRATLSRYELVWLFYNGLSVAGNPKFKKLIEKYALLKNMREDLLTLSRENEVVLTRKGLTRQTLQDYGYPDTDYNFWVTADENATALYYVSAFYNKDELREGIRKARDWENLMKMG